MKSKVQELAERMHMSCDEFVGEMRKRGSSEPTALKIWKGEYETFVDYNDNNVQLSSLRKAAMILNTNMEMLFPNEYVR